MRKDPSKIKARNDRARRNLQRDEKCHFVLSQAVGDLSSSDLESLLQKVKDFDDFDEGNDPYGEHDFGSVEFKNTKYFFKFTYYDKGWEYGEDPYETDDYYLMLMIMEASEY